MPEWLIYPESNPNFENIEKEVSFKKKSPLDVPVGIYMALNQSNDVFECRRYSFLIRH